MRPTPSAIPPVVYRSPSRMAVDSRPAPTTGLGRALAGGRAHIRRQLISLVGLLLCGMVTLAAADPDINSDLVLRLTLDQTSGTTADDSAGAHPAAFNDSPTWVTSGQIDGALEFDGSNDWLSGSDADDLDDTNALTVAFWFRADDVSGIQGLVSKRVDYNDNNSWGMYLDGNQLKVDIDGNNDRFAITSTISATTWYHVAVVYDGTLSSGSRVKVYLDGVLDKTASETSSSIPNNTSGFCVARLCANSSSYFDGKLDEVRVYQRALSSDDVDALYDFTGPVMPTDTWRYYRLNVTDIISESLNGRVSELNYYEGTTNHPTTAMTSNSSGGMVADASTDTSNAYKAFDNDNGTRWQITQASLPAWLSIDFGSGNDFAVDAVEIRSDQGHRAPEEFTIEGSNDGTNWTELLSQTGGTNNTTYQLPTAGRDVYVVEGTTQLVVAASGVLANDSLAGTGTMVAELIDDVDNGTLALANDGSFTYTADSGFSGEDTFTYRAINETHSSEATVMLRVVGGDIVLTMTTEDNQRVVMKKGNASFGVDMGVGEELTVTVPWTTTATSVTLTQPGSGTGEVYFGATGTDTTKTVTTSGGTPNEVVVPLRHKTTSGELADVEIHAAGGGKTGDTFATAIELSSTPMCAYLADQRTVTQTFTTTPAVSGVSLEVAQAYAISGQTQTASASSFSFVVFNGATDATGQTTATISHSEATVYCYYVTKVTRTSSGSTESTLVGSDYKEVVTHGEKMGPPSETDPDGVFCYTCSSGDDEDAPQSVDISDGEKKILETDLRIPGRGLDWQFTRAYRAGARRGSNATGDFADHWQFNYADEFLVKDGSGDVEDSNVIHFLPGHTGYLFVNVDTDAWETPTQRFTQLNRTDTASSSSDLTVRYRDGRVHEFHGFSGSSTDGRLKAIRDRNDNEITFHYAEIDPDETDGDTSDKKHVLIYAIDTMGREIRYRYYAKHTNGSVLQTDGNGRTITVDSSAAGAYGRLARVNDFKGDMDFSDNDTSEDFSGQTNNRELIFDYDSESNLVRCTTPVITGTPTSNNFTVGKTTRYAYITASNRGGLSQAAWDALSTAEQDLLKHSMTRIWWPNEVAATPGSDPADSEAAIVIGYETDSSDPFFGFATSYTFGGENDNGVPSGGTITYTYTDLNPTRAMPANTASNATLLIKEESLQIAVDDRNGNDAVYVYGGERMLLDYEEQTSGVRSSEPSSFDLARTHNVDRLLAKLTLPEGNSSTRTYNESSDDRFQQANLIRMVRTPDVTRGGDQDTIEHVFVYEPIYNRPCLHVMARGANSTDNDFTPPIADLLTRTMTDPYDATKTLDLRYATVEFFDYQESTTAASAWSATSSFTPTSVDSETVLATEVLLLRELGLAEGPTDTERTASIREVRTRLSDNLTGLGLGDLNGDGDTDPVVAGNIIRTVQASPVLIDGSNQHALETDIDGSDLIDASLSYADGGSNEGSTAANRERLQTIVTLRQYNDLGQLTKVIDPEGNVTAYTYFPEDDPDGDSVDTPSPADGRTLDTVTGGYLDEVVRDTTRSYTQQTSGSSITGTFSNNDENPTITQITTSYVYDDVGNRIETTDPRGITHDFFVNEHNQTVRVRRATVVTGADSASPADPLSPASAGADEELQAYAYESRRLFDFNGNLVLGQVEDAGNTSSVDGSGLGTLPSQATDTTPGLSTADSAGGTAYADTLHLYDRIDNHIETRREVDNTSHLATRMRYDANQNRVLTIHPADNADGAVYDERDLLFERIRGVSTRPSDGLYATGDPSSFDRSGGSGTTASTITYNYDKNANVVEIVDAADTDSDSGNGSTIAGAGDVTAFTYDGYDRRKTTTDAMGNVTTVVYDPDSNVTRVIRDGDPVKDDDDNSGTGNKTLAVTEYIHDNLSRVIATHQVLFQTPDVSPTRTPTLTDTVAMDSLAAYLSDASSDTASVPAATGITVIGRVSSLREYDRLSRATFTVEDDLDTTRADYDGAGRTIATEDSHSATGFASGSFDPANLDGNRVQLAYDDNNNVIERLETDVTDIANVADETFRTTFLYDSLDRLQTSFDNLGQASDQRYDSRGNLVASADAVGPVNSRSYSRRGLGSSSSVTVNDFGNVTRARYDGINRTLEDEVILTDSGQNDNDLIGADLDGVLGTGPTADTNQSGDGLLSTYYAYDDNSQLLALRDDNGNTTAYIYDNQNRLLTERKGLAETGTSFSITGGDSGSFNVSLRGAATTPVDTETNGTDIDYVYDADSNVTQTTDEATNDIDCTYDALNRRLSCTITRATGFIGSTSQTHDYDGLSRQTACFDNNEPTPTTDDVTCTYAYDSLSRVVEETQQIGASGVTRAISCSFDIATAGAEGVCSSTTYPDGRVVDTTYDRLDRLVDRTDNGQSSAIGTYAYIGAYRVGTLSYQNDTRLTHIGQVASQNADVGFDGLRRIVDHRWEFDSTGTTALGNGTLRLGFGHADNSGNPAYDRANNKLIEEKQHATDLSETYVYDSAYRLAALSSTYRSVTGGSAFRRGTLNTAKTDIVTLSLTGLTGALQVQDWTLDGVHNWNSNTHTSQGGTAQTESRTHTDFNEISAVSGTPYGGAPTRTDAHDKNGNLTDDGVLEYEWDAKNRLRRVTLKSSSNTIAEYTYDCQNRRFRKVISNGGKTGSTTNGTTNYYYHGWQVVQEENGSDAVQRQYVYGTYIDEPWVLDDRSASQSVADLNDGSGADRLFYHCNTQYSVHGLSDETGALDEGYIYDAYGRQTVFAPGTNGTIDWGGDDSVTINGPSLVDNEYMYTGRRFNTELENYYFRNRYYDALRGRFIGRDAVYIDGLNLYSGYIYLAYVDPFGRNVASIHIGPQLMGNEKYDWTIWLKIIHPPLGSRSARGKTQMWIANVKDTIWMDKDCKWHKDLPEIQTDVDPLKKVPDNFTIDWNAEILGTRDPCFVRSHVDKDFRLGDGLQPGTRKGADAADDYAKMRLEPIAFEMTIDYEFFSGDPECQECTDGCGLAWLFPEGYESLSIQGGGMDYFDIWRTGKETSNDPPLPE